MLFIYLFIARVKLLKYEYWLRFTYFYLSIILLVMEYLHSMVLVLLLTDLNTVTTKCGTRAETKNYFPYRLIK